MKYYINYTNEGKIVGFLTLESDTDLNIEVSNAIWIEGQSYNKIIIDGDNMTFDKIDWRTPEEIVEEDLQVKLAEAKLFLDRTDKKVMPYYEFEYGDNSLEWYIKQRSIAREFIRNNQ